MITGSSYVTDSPSIGRARGLAAGTSLRLLERSTVEQAYAWFLKRFDRLMKVSGNGEA